MPEVQNNTKYAIILVVALVLAFLGYQFFGKPEAVKPIAPSTQPIAPPPNTTHPLPTEFIVAVSMADDKWAAAIDKIAINNVGSVELASDGIALLVTNIKATPDWIGGDDLKYKLSQVTESRKEARLRVYAADFLWSGGKGSLIEKAKV